MAKYSNIEWTHHTFNPWWGCTKVSPACAHCYAETWSLRFGSKLWGREAERRFFGENHWREPLRWNAEARTSGIRARVFCASMADVFEPRADLNPWREKLWLLIEQTPHLDWLLLTKRPGQIKRLYPWARSARKNVWLGTTAENQRWADRRIERLIDIDASVRFLSCEPLLSSIDLQKWLKQGLISWVIAGGESGVNARPTHPNWVRSIRDQCNEYYVPFHFKQWGHWSPEAQIDVSAKAIELSDESGARELLFWRSKKLSGRILDGETWDGFPQAAMLSALGVKDAKEAGKQRNTT